MKLQHTSLVFVSLVSIVSCSYENDDTADLFEACEDIGNATEEHTCSVDEALGACVCIRNESGEIEEQQIPAPTEVPMEPSGDESGEPPEEEPDEREPIDDSISENVNLSNVTCDSPLADIRAAIVELTNRSRTEGVTCGQTPMPSTTPLTYHGQLESAARIHSDDMSANDFFSHTGSNGSTVATRTSEQGYRFRAVGENLAGGYPTLEAAHNGWLLSEGHCQNIMNPAYNDIGAACTSRLWTVVFGRQ